MRAVGAIPVAQLHDRALLALRVGAFIAHVAILGVYVERGIGWEGLALLPAKPRIAQGIHHLTQVTLGEAGADKVADGGSVALEADGKVVLSVHLGGIEIVVMVLRLAVHGLHVIPCEEMFKHTIHTIVINRHVLSLFRQVIEALSALTKRQPLEQSRHRGERVLRIVVVVEEDVGLLHVHRLSDGDGQQAVPIGTTPVAGLHEAVVGTVVVGLHVAVLRRVAHAVAGIVVEHFLGEPLPNHAEHVGHLRHRPLAMERLKHVGQRTALHLLEGHAGPATVHILVR